MCGVCDKGTKECPNCSKRKGGGKQLRFSEQKYLVLCHEIFDVFWESFYAVALQKHKMHYWKMIVQSKKFLNDPREKSLNVGDACIGHNFTDALIITPNNEAQSNSFAGISSKKVSIEGYTVVSHDSYDYVLKLDFHSFLSDSRIQEARTVLVHLTKLIDSLIEEKKLTKGKRLLCVTDGCAKASICTVLYCIVTFMFFSFVQYNCCIFTHELFYFVCTVFSI